MLDIGCGDIPRGDVNCDLHQECKAEEYGYWQDRHMEAKKNPNFIQCDMTHLPFQDKSFDIVYACQVLEHVPDYITALQEMIRVASKLIFISVPSVELEFFPTHHFHFFHPRTFQNLCRHLGFTGHLQSYDELGEYIFLLEF
jgi:ubiquinone/menaquinone biosynthesis C-methylase UbiE